MTEYALQIIWYLVVATSVVFYVMLDGFDLGVGCLHLFVKKDEHRRLFLNSIGPVWDGNEVWLVIIVGALFSGFPDIYATVMSSFYTMLMAFLAGIMLRAVAIEFRSKKPSPRWRNFWDVFFSLSSLVITFLLGVILGNLIKGIPINRDGEFTGSCADFFSPYTVIIGVFSLSLFMMHGCIYLIMKTKDELHDKLRRWIYPTIFFFIGMFFVATIVTFIYDPHMLDRMKEEPWFFILPVFTFLAIANIPREVKKDRDGRAFISSCLSMLFLFALFGVGTFPIVLRSSTNPAEFSLTLLNSASPFTLKILLTIAIIGVPLVLAYGFYIYRIFRGKVELEASSY